MICIYKITNTITGKYYIGSTTSHEKRKHQHFTTLKNGTHHNIHLQRSYNKYGRGAFKFEVVESFDSKVDALKEEQALLDKIARKQETFNISLSATGGDFMSNHPDAERLKVEAGNRLLAWRDGLSEEDKKEISIKMSGSGNPNWRGGFIPRCDCGKRKAPSADSCEGCRNRTGDKNPFFGKRHSDETKQKIAEARRGKIPANSRKVQVGEEIYVSMTEAARQHGMTAAAAHYRIKHKTKWLDWSYVED